ncbi:MAG: hypothetical protein AAF385_08955, partial [Pseudomonadota bacterium]
IALSMAGEYSHIDGPLIRTKNSKKRMPPYWHDHNRSMGPCILVFRNFAKSRKCAGKIPQCAYFDPKQPAKRERRDPLLACPLKTDRYCQTNCMGTLGTPVQRIKVTKLLEI